MNVGGLLSVMWELWYLVFPFLAYVLWCIWIIRRRGKALRRNSYFLALKSGATRDQAIKHASREYKRYYQRVFEAMDAAFRHAQSSRLESEALRYYERKNREGS